MRSLFAVAMTALLAACAAPIEPNWTKTGGTPQDLSADMGQCKAQAYAVPGVSGLQAAIVYDSCMQGKGYTVAPSEGGQKACRPTVRGGAIVYVCT